MKLLGVFLFLIGIQVLMGHEYHVIQIVDSETKRGSEEKKLKKIKGVPMVQLKTVNKMEYWTDR